MQEYINCWHKPRPSQHSRATYQTNVRPVKYKGCEIFKRVDDVWDVVLAGHCITQRAGPNGAKSYIDSLEVRPQYVTSAGGYQFFVDINGLWGATKDYSDEPRCTHDSLSAVKKLKGIHS